jgi:cell division protein FtsB
MSSVPKDASSPQRFAAVRSVWSAAFAGRRKAATLAAAALALAVAYHVVFGANGLTVYEQKRQETHALRAQMQDLQRENTELKGHVDRLENDPSAIEHQAREELHYARPGEVIYTMPVK